MRTSPASQFSQFGSTEYVKLLKKIGVGNYWNEIENTINRSNGYAMKYYDYLKSGF